MHIKIRGSSTVCLKKLRRACSRWSKSVADNGIITIVALLLLHFYDIYDYIFIFISPSGINGITIHKNYINGHERDCCQNI